MLLSCFPYFYYFKTFSDTNIDANFALGWQDFNSNMDDIENTLGDFTNAGNNLYNDGYIEQNMIGLAQEFFDTLLSAYTIDSSVSPIDTTIKSINEFNNSINSFTQNVYDNYTVTYYENDKEGNTPAFFIVAASIAKHSFEYWRNSVTDQNHPWYSYELLRRRRHAGHGNSAFFHALGVAWKDVTGFIAGNKCTYNCNGICIRIGCKWRAGGASSASY
tara:strand:+ start:444 stop:1097 length:654 start_codon:yes stop_codon:yes gene_type:complete